MHKFITIFILSIIITTAIRIYSEKYNLTKPEIVEEDSKLPFDQKVKITAKQGIIGCLERSQFETMVRYSKIKYAEAMRELMDHGLCFYLANGSELLMQKDSCHDEDSAEEIFPFLFGDKKLYFSCFAVR